MAGTGPYLWVNRYAPPAGFHRVPPGGMCLSVFLFVRRGNRLLLGKVREHPSWQGLAGEGADRMRSDTGRWKIPARVLKLGEDPRAAARDIGERMLGIPGMRYREPRVEVEFWRLGAQASGPPARRKLFHYDIWFLVDAALSQGGRLAAPPWFEELAWVAPAGLSKREWGRFHDDVYARWRQARARR